MRKTRKRVEKGYMAPWHPKGLKMHELEEYLCAKGNQPWWNIASLLHKGSQGEPKTVKYPKFISLVTGRLVAPFLELFSMPFIRAEAADQEEDNAYSNVGKNNAHPNLISQGIQKGKDPWLGFLRFFYHDGYAQAHKWLGKVYDFFSDEGDG